MATADDLQLKVTLTGDGKRLSGTLRDAQGEVRQFGDMSDRQGQRASSSMERTGQSVEAVGRDLRDAQGEVRQFGDTSDRQGRRASAAMDRTGRSVETVGGHLREMNGIGKTVRSTLLGAGTALVGMSAGTGVLLAMGRQASQTAAEIQRLSRIAGTSTEEFQSLAYGAAQYGVEQDKLADIIRDTQDRIGDFLQTGAGEFVDFFEQIAPQANLSAEALARMSGPDALQAVYSALENAGLSASEMTFYMEALASDATELIPLLRDSGAEVDRLGREADELNVVLSDLELQRLKDIRSEFHQLEQQLSTETARAVSQFDELIKSSLEGISWGINNVARGFNVFMDDFRENDAKRSIAGIDAELNTLFDTKQRLEERINLFGEDSAQVQDAKAALEELKGEYDELIDRKIQIQQAGQPVTEPEVVQIARASAEFKTLNEWLFETTESTESHSEATASASESTDTFATDLASLREQLDPAYAASQKLAEATSLLDQGLASGALTLDQYLGLWDQAAERFTSAGDGAKDAANTVDDESDAMATLWERRLERMDDAAVDMWRSFLDGSEDAFGSFKRLAIDTLAEVIHQYTTRQITASIGANIGGGQGGGGVGQGGTGNMRLPNANSLMNGWNMAQNAYAGWTGTFGSQLGMQGGVSGTAIGSANAVANGTGAQGAWNAAAGAGGAGGAAGGTSLGWTSYGSGGGWAGGLANMGAGLVASYAGGYVGDQVSSAVSDKQANSNYGQTAGAAIGSIWGPLGTAAGAAIGSVIDTVFGSPGNDLDIAMVRAAEQEFDTEGRWDKGIRAKSAFGTVGFDEDGSHEIADLWDVDDAQKVIDAVAQLDNLFASIADSDQELEAMKQAVMSPDKHGIQGHYGETSTPGDVVGILTSRYREAFAATGSQFQDLFERLFDDGLDAGAKEVTQFAVGLDRVEDALAGNQQALADARAEIEAYSGDLEAYVGAAESMSLAAQTMGVLEQASQRMGITFDATASGAIHAASQLQAAAGGVQQLAALEDQFYQQYASQTEQAARSYSSVYDAIRQVTDEVPETVAGYRRLVEAQDLNTQAGREARIALLRLAPAWKEVAGSVEDVIGSIYQDVLNRAPDDAGLNYYVDAIQSGSMTVSDALNAIRSSSEAAAVAADGAADSIGGLSDAAQIASQRAQMEIEILRLQGRDAEALRRERELELDALDDSLAPLQKRIWALEDASAAEQEASRQTAQRTQALQRAQETLNGFTTSIESWLDQLNATDQGLASPGDQLAAASAAYEEQLAAARAGDRDALGSITQYADRFIAAQKEWSGSGGDTASVIDRITAELANLPDQLTPEQFLADEITTAIGNSTSSMIESITTLSSSVTENFDSLDTNVDGLLTFDELKTGLAGKASDAEIIRLIERVDTNGDGMISAQELSNARLSGLADSIGRELAPMFDSIDLDTDGIIDWNEFHSAFRGLATNSELRDIYRKLDANGDGTLSRLEAIRRSGEGTEDNTAPLDLANSLDGLPVSLARDHMPGAWIDMAYNIASTFSKMGVTGFAKGGAFVAGTQAFAKGGAFTNQIVSSPTLFDLGLMGEAGPEAIMPLQRGPDGSLGVRAEIQPVIMPPPPPQQSGSHDAALLREANALHREMTQLLEELRRYAQSDQAQRGEGFQRVERATERGNRMLEKLVADKRLEEARA